MKLILSMLTMSALLFVCCGISMGNEYEKSYVLTTGTLFGMGASGTVDIDNWRDLAPSGGGANEYLLSETLTVNGTGYADCIYSTPSVSGIFGGNTTFNGTQIGINPLPFNYQNLPLFDNSGYTDFWFSYSGSLPVSGLSNQLGQTEIFQPLWNPTISVSSGQIDVDSWYSNATFNVTYITDDPDPVPEPSTVVLLGAGLAGLAIYAKRRINNKQA